MIPRLIFSLLPLVAAALPGQSTPSNSSSRPNHPDTPPPLYSGPAEAERRHDIEAAIKVLADHAKTLPEGGPQQKNLQAAADGLTRMSKKGRFRTRRHADMPSDGYGDTVAVTESPASVDKPADGQPMPGPGGTKRDASEDCNIDFDVTDWQDDDENGTPVPSGWRGGRSGQNIEVLAIYLWHEW